MEEQLSLETKVFDNLILYFDEYIAAQNEVPYNGDKVQGLGLRFAAEWNRLKKEICSTLNESEDDFSYVKWRNWVPRLR